MTPDALVLEQQFDFAKRAGWLPFFQKSATEYDWSPALIMAIASRETNMENIIGDRGHGYSLMQIDTGSYPEWCYSGAWQHPEEAIEKGVQVLEMKRTQLGKGVGKPLLIAGYRFTGKEFPDQESLDRCSTAAYNCGLWSYYSFSKNEDVDRFTTGHDYSYDVWKRKAIFEKLLAAETGP